MAKSSTRLVLICGLPASGKSALARQLAPKIPAIRLDKDGWATQLGADLWDEEFRVRPPSAASPKCRVGAVRKTVVRTDSGSNDDIEDFDQASFQVVCRARIEPSIRATSKHVGTPIVRHPLSYLVEPGGLEPPTCRRGDRSPG